MTPFIDVRLFFRHGKLLVDRDMRAASPWLAGYFVQTWLADSDALTQCIS